MSTKPPTDRKVIEVTECPVPDCNFVSVFEYDGDHYVGAREVADHLNEDHEPWEVPDMDTSELIGQ